MWGFFCRIKALELDLQLPLIITSIILLYYYLLWGYFEFCYLEALLWCLSTRFSHTHFVLHAPVINYRALEWVMMGMSIFSVPIPMVMWPGLYHRLLTRGSLPLCWHAGLPLSRVVWILQAIFQYVGLFLVSFTQSGQYTKVPAGFTAEHQGQRENLKSSPPKRYVT